VNSVAGQSLVLTTCPAQHSAYKGRSPFDQGKEPRDKGWGAKDMKRP
jgi:hypothetical protein